MAEHVQHSEIDGHKVPVGYESWFYNGDDGSRISDEQWDEQMRRVREVDPNFRFPKVGA